MWSDLGLFVVRIGSLATIFVLAHFLYRMCSQIGTTMGPQLGFLEGQRRKAKKQKVPQIIDFTALSEFCELIYITCKLFSAEREVPEPNRYNSLIFSCLHITTFLRVASIQLNCEYFVIMQ